MTKKYAEGKIDKIFDNSKNNDKGVFIYNYTIDLVDGKRLYTRQPLNPMPSSGNDIGFDIIADKTSASGNPYQNVENIVVLGEGEGIKNPQSITNTPGHKTDSNKDRLIYVTGIVGRAMSSGSFTELKIDTLTEEAVKSFNKHLA